MTPPPAAPLPGAGSDPVPGTPPAAASGNPVAMAPTNPTAPAVTPSAPQRAPEEVPAGNNSGVSPAASFSNDFRLAYAAGENSVVIFRDMNSGTWVRVTEMTPLVAGTVMLVPDPFETTFTAQLNANNNAPAVAPAGADASKAPMQFDVLSGSVIRWGGAIADAPGSMLVERGRVALTMRQVPESADKLPAWVFQVGATFVKIESKSPELLAGIEVQWRTPTRFEQDLGVNRTTAGLYLKKGTALVTVGNAEPRELTDGMFFAITPNSQQPEHLASDPPIPAALPEWLNPDSRQLSLAVKRFATLFERQFDVGAMVELNMLALVVDPRPKMSELAVETLGLMGRMDGLVEALAKSENEEARMTAFHMLREWLGHLPATGGIVKEELLSEYPEATANEVYRLLWGFSPNDVRNRLTSQELLDLMANSKVEIREMAFWYVQKLTGKRLDYRPIDIPGRREAALQKWHALLQKDGALVMPEQPALIIN